jgi:hypothetical protein
VITSIRRQFGGGQMISMSARSRIVLFGSALVLTGCSLTTAFDDFSFGHHDAGAVAGDGGGGGSPSGDGGVVDGGNHAGDGAAGGGGSDAGVPAAGSGGDGAVAVSCRDDSDCPDPLVYRCKDEICVLRRVPFPAWVSGGGGISRSSKYNLRVSSGAPQPGGSVKSKNFIVSVGAGAGRP